MSMRMKNKSTSWKYDVKRVIRFLIKHANTLERRKSINEIKTYLKQRKIIMMLQ